MASVIDSVDIKGMKPLDFDQLYQMYLDQRDTGEYYGRKDYWDKRIERLDTWLRELQSQVHDVIIEEK